MSEVGTLPAEIIDTLIVGSGFAGLAMAIKLKKAGTGSFLIIEKGADIGGTWRDNAYPGAACDIPSHLYSLSFEPKADWSRMYPGQAELQTYLLDVTAKHGLRQHIRFKTALREATWDEAASLWRVGIGDDETIAARVLISAIGAFHYPAIPHLPGIETFEGKAFHSSAWDHAFDLRGKRVAVVGTGASAIQFVPQIAPDVARLSVFQRTPPWINPKIDYPLSVRRQKALRYIPFYRRLMRARLFALHEVRVLGFAGNLAIMKMAEKIALRHMGRAIKDPALRAKVTPNYTLGCKRVLISNDYYPALTRDNVELVTEGIATVRPNGIVTRDGREHPADAIIYGTGFHATDSFSYTRIVGREGVLLADHLDATTEAFWGIAVRGFPNYFMLLGPNTGLGHNSVVLMIEAQVRYIMSALKQMRRRNLRVAEVRADAMHGFTTMLKARMDKTVWQVGGCKSWYQDERGRNTTLWPGSVVEYVWKTRKAALADYEVR